MRSFDQIRRHLHTSGFRVSLDEETMVCVELSLDHGQRHQAIFLAEIEDEDGRRFLRVSTAIGPATAIDAERALAFNWQSRVGYLAIGDLDGTAHLQLCENRPYDGLTIPEIERLVLELGGLGDRMERALSGGDRF
ncbi:MAG TPA: hypothetical protein VEY50_10045 [Lysobacter sp.]|nr:hypothetical protein [Lysobacter sp.]